MKLDNLSNPIFDNNDVFDILYSGNLELLSEITVIESDEIKTLESISDLKLKKFYELPINIEDFDYQNQQHWFMPEEYQNFDIENWLYKQCKNNNQLTRAKEELVEFNRRGMILLLKWLKFFVDTCRNNKILWGVGRGSSVSSYVLYLIGVHRIDSLKYNLDWREFLR